MKQNDYFNNKTLLITGGTGSFGSTVLKRFLTSDIGEIRIFRVTRKSRTIYATNCRQSIPIMRIGLGFTLVMSVI